MIKILKQGYLKKIECSGCGSLLQYNEQEDVLTKEGVIFNLNLPAKTTKYIICPTCNENIILKADR